jgi:hypothetical protein
MLPVVDERRHLRGKVIPLAAEAVKQDPVHRIPR